MDHTMSEDRETDILVVGGGMAGVFAALGAAKKGVPVLLVEPSNLLGGQGTGGGVAGFCGDTRRVNDPFHELIETLERFRLIEAYAPGKDRLAYELEPCAYFLQAMLEKAGVEVFLRAHAVGADVHEGKVESVDLAARGRLIKVRPQSVIDATGECRIAEYAGFERWHEGACKQLPMSLYFTLWDTGKPVEPFLPPECPKWEHDEAIPMTSLHVFDTGKVEVKMKVVGFDADCPQSISDAERFARRQMMGLTYFLQTKGYKGRVLNRHVLASVSRHIGVREGARIVGEYALTEDDVRHAAVFDDAVAVGTYHLDYHWPDKAERAGTGITTMVEPYHIPLRSLVPKGAQNLLVAGRGLSGDQMAMSSYRVMAICAQTGFAAGVAARHLLQSAERFNAVGHETVRSIQAELRARGQSLDLSDYGEYLQNQILIRESAFDEAPFASCHASTLVQLENNRILVACFGGTREGHEDVGIWLAERYRGRWSAPRQIARVRNAPHWNPVLFSPDRKTVYLYFKVGPSPKDWETFVSVSNDGGANWLEPVPLKVQGGAKDRGPVKNKPIVLKDGIWLAPCSIETDSAWDVCVDRSEDGGQEWIPGDLIPIEESVRSGKGAIQPTLWESEPGHVHLLARSTCGSILRSDSEDGGRTWTALKRTSLPNNNSGLDLTRLPDGSLALVMNPVEGETMRSPRSPLSILISKDNGLSWSGRLDLETEAGEFSYPAVIPTALGLAVCYTWNRKNISFWHGSAECIPEVQPAEKVGALAGR